MDLLEKTPINELSRSNQDECITTHEEKSVCRMCHGGCGAIVTMANNHPIEIRGDSSNPASDGYFCGKGKASIELLNHPDRLRTPLKKIEVNGENKFVQISWDEALDTITQKFSTTIKQKGPESIAFAQGTDRNYQEWVFRLANALGTPNVVGPAHVCFYPRVMASILTFGGFTFSDYEGNPETVVLWGSNKLHTHSDGVIGIKLSKALKQGSQLIVIDPFESSQARQADYWLQIQPGSDGALALGMLNLIIENNWFDTDFVAEFTSGFEELKLHVSQYDLTTVAHLTGLAKSEIYDATKLYAQSSSATIEAGTGISQNKNAFDTLRSVYMLSALSGNLDSKGGDLLWDPMAIDGRRSFPRTENLSDEQARKRLGSEKHRILSMTGWVSPDALWDSILMSKPYTTECLLVFGSNLLTSHANTQRIEEALTALDFLVVCDLFMTPTAKMADIVLPVASWLERDQIVEFNAYISPRKKLAQVGDCKPDEEIIIELAKRLGISQHFWPTVSQALDHKLTGLNMSWDEFKKTGPILNNKSYQKHIKKGFSTRNGKVNLYHHGLKQMGYDPLPTYHALEEEQYNGNVLPYILTSAHSRYFYNSEYHQLSSLNKRQDTPLLTMHIEAATTEGVKLGDSILVYTTQYPSGVIFEVNITSKIPDNVVYVDACWWYPNTKNIKDSLRSSINLLTNAKQLNPQMGSNNLRGFRVGLVKVTCPDPMTKISKDLINIQDDKRNSICQLK